MFTRRHPYLFFLIVCLSLFTAYDPVRKITTESTEARRRVEQAHIPLLSAFRGSETQTTQEVRDLTPPCLRALRGETTEPT